MADEDNKKDYRRSISRMGKKEFTLQKMQEYGFWPKYLPTPYEQQANETPEIYAQRKDLKAELDKVAGQLAALYEDRAAILTRLNSFRRQYEGTWDPEKIRKDIAQEIMKESIARRNERKRQKEEAKAEVSRRWQQLKAESIVFIGKGYSGGLSDKANDVAKLAANKLPAINDDKELAALLGLEYTQLRFLCYHRDAALTDHYYRYQIPKRNGKLRSIAAPKSILKNAQRRILSEILELIPVSVDTHGFLKGHSVLTGALTHNNRPELLVNIDMEDFFPTISFKRVRGLFKSLGYSGYIASLLAMLCTDCSRTPLEVKGRTMYVKTSERVLPQGSPASPMITNIICRRLDEKMRRLSEKHSFTYSRYADDMSFSFGQKPEGKLLREILYDIQCVVYSEGFRINQEKTKLLGRGSRQSVTGIVLNNDQPGVPRVWARRLRAALHNAEKAHKKGALTIETVREISGMAAWLKLVNAERYEGLIAKAKAVTTRYRIDN